jgi:uncharacterized protein YcbK (DUF882 family)
MGLPRRPRLVTLLATLAICGPSTWGRPAAAEEAPAIFVAPHHSEELVLFGVGPDGMLRPPELGLLAQLLRCRRTGREHPIDAALARVLVVVARHFGRPVHVVSGYRAAPADGHPHSFHVRGMAADVAVPGVSPQEIRDYAVARGLGGIGFYPNSGFVHLDIRPRRFWWVDYSSPSHREGLVPDPEGAAPPRRQTALVDAASTTF